ncbi:uncharacterized protein GGS25DRAFT_520531 [Hypoxylon fragiforme]|uniref:uncharacterized protein n=1 Tax=Hypoxylon fragiforme TaxID=63214 RepID=UPI0020C5D981|nr:uncharacterized protein GGS25DRAFT_520531 [Hypoxylon fragiforme]KAI2609727.1 hypothetical protein GGS25DRAFT_520531 [Hypoxylon fragiforme]
MQQVNHRRFSPSAQAVPEPEYLPQTISHDVTSPDLDGLSDPIDNSAFYQPVRTQRPFIMRRTSSISPFLQPSPTFYPPPQSGNPRHFSSIPAARGYLPQQMWPREYRSTPGGTRAIPLRIPRSIMNKSDSHPSSIPLLQSPSVRPYSVPASLNRNTSKDGPFYLPRPATSLTFNDNDNLSSPHPLAFPQRRASQMNHIDSLISSSTTSGEIAQIKKPRGSIRAVAKRGSGKLSSDTGQRESNYRESGQTMSTSKTSLSPLQGPKRAAQNDLMNSNSSKRLKINVIRDISTLCDSKNESRIGAITTVPQRLQRPETDGTLKVSQHAPSKLGADGILFEGKSMSLDCQSVVEPESTVDAREEPSWKLDDDDPEPRLFRIAELLSAQKEKGMGEYVKSRLGSGEPNVLEVTANEVLLGMVAADSRLLGQAIHFM